MWLLRFCLQLLSLRCLFVRCVQNVHQPFVRSFPPLMRLCLLLQEFCHSRIFLKRCFKSSALYDAEDASNELNKRRQKCQAEQCFRSRYHGASCLVDEVAVRFIVSTLARQRLASTSSHPRRDSVSPLHAPYLFIHHSAPFNTLAKVTHNRYGTSSHAAVVLTRRNAMMVARMAHHNTMISIKANPI